MKSKYKYKKSTKNANIQDNIAKKRRKKRCLASVLIAIFTIPSVLIAISIGIFALWAKSVPLDKNLLPTQTASPTFYDADGDKIPYLQDDYVNPDEIPNHLRNAFVALEDKRFYKHKGYDVVRICGALIHNIRSRSVKEGASTITQQLVKNTHLTHERTIKRKLKEIAISAKLEKEYSKDEILAMYLSVIYFGNGAYGVKQASRIYFDKDVEYLTLSECATLAGIVKNPKKYSPSAENSECEKRRNVVLSIMKEQGYIEENEYLNALNEEIYNKETATALTKSSKSIYDFYIERAKEEVCKNLDITQYQLSNSGAKIYTYLNKDIQSLIARETNDKINYDGENVNRSSCVLDNKTNSVVAYYSTLPYEVKRQAGSVLKPIAVFAPALNEGIITLATPMVDEEVDYNGYAPRNFSNIYYGETTIRDSIKKSMNSVAIKTIDYLSITKSCEYLNTFGIETTKTDQNYAVGLGALSNGVSPVKIGEAYMTLANNGVHSTPHFVKYVLFGDNTNGSFEFATQQTENVAVSPATSSLMKSVLVDTVKDGTAKTLSALKFDVAGKTGTAQRSDATNSDAWLASFNENFTVVVWHGSDLPMNERGGGQPALTAMKIWRGIDGMYPQPQLIDTSQNTVDLLIDTYATSQNRQVMLASENTPLEYRKTELFDINNSPLTMSKSFDRICDDINMSVSLSNDGAQISFDAKKIYTYRVYRVIDTSKILLEKISGADGKITVSDNAMSIFGFAEYEIECIITSNPTVKKTFFKQVFFDI